MTEADDNGLTYLLPYQLEIIAQAMEQQAPEDLARRIESSAAGR